MPSLKAGRKTSSVASTVWHVASSKCCQYPPLQFVQYGPIFAIDCKGRKNGSLMPVDQNSRQTVTRFECVGFWMYACGFFVPQMRQFCLFTYPPYVNSGFEPQGCNDQLCMYVYNMASSNINLTIKVTGKDDSPFSLTLTFTVLSTCNDENQFICTLKSSP